MKTIIITILLVSTLAQANWVDDWGDQSTRSGPSYFEGQKRNYFTGGAYQARFRNSNESLFSVQMPRLSAGCGGIDAFSGSVSFMDTEYLVEKFQKAMQMAPAVGIDIALKALMPELAATIGKLEGIGNQLNSMSISECGIAKGAVDLATQAFTDQGKLAQMFDSETSINEGTSKNSTNAQQLQKANNNKPTKEQSAGVEGCSTEFKKIFATNGSVLEHIFEIRGLEKYANFMRAYLGDVIIDYQDKQFTQQRIEKCPETTVIDTNDILAGKAKIRPISGVCRNSTDRGLEDIVEEKLLSITTKMKNKTALTSDDIKFLNSLPFDNLNSIHKYVKLNQSDFYIQQFKSYMARQLSFALVEDIIQKVTELQLVAIDQAATAETGANSKTCNIGLVLPIIKSVKAMGKRARAMLSDIKKKKSEYQQEIINQHKINQIINQKDR